MPPGAGRDWETTFEQLVAAPSVPEARECLAQYLASNPLDEVALRPGAIWVWHAWVWAWGWGWPHGGGPGDPLPPS